MTFGFPMDPPAWFACLCLGLLGLCVGSFLNVVVIRVPRGRSIHRPSSRCGFCRSSIPFWMNIPVLSFLFSGGACVKCGHRFSARYAMVELLTCILFVAITACYGWSAQTLLYCLFAAALLAMTFIDLELKIIPDQISIGGWVVAMLLAALQIGWYPLSFFDALIGSLVGYFIFWIVSRVFYFVTHEEGLGGGDIKLMGFVGAMLGWQGAVSTIVVGNVLGLVVGIISIICLKKSRRTPIPFGPFLAMGALVHLLRLDQWWWS
jgi:leader peptidase (prepilin peptidase)/N-methyltransferase